MVSRVLLPINGRDHARRSFDLAADLFPEATFVLLHVINPSDASVSIDGAMPSFPEGWYEQQQAQADKVFVEIDQLAAEEGIETKHVIELGKPSRKILDTITALEIDHVVMSSHRRQGVSRLLLGSTAETVIRCSSIPITIAP